MSITLRMCVCVCVYVKCFTFIRLPLMLVVCLLLVQNRNTQNKIYRTTKAISFVWQQSIILFITCVCLLAMQCLRVLNFDIHSTSKELTHTHTPQSERWLPRQLSTIVRRRRNRTIIKTGIRSDGLNECKRTTGTFTMLHHPECEMITKGI